MIAARLTADAWLWTAELASRKSGHVANDKPLRPTRREGAGLNCMCVYEVDEAPGTLLVATPAGTSSRGDGPWGGRHAVLRLMPDGSLAPVPMELAADELDPAGALARRHRRLVLVAGLTFGPTRFRVPEDHGYVVGEGTEWGGYWGVVERVTARQVWVRGPTLHEMQDIGLPITRSDDPGAVFAAACIRPPEP